MLTAVFVRAPQRRLNEHICSVGIAREEGEEAFQGGLGAISARLRGPSHITTQCHQRRPRNKWFD